MSLPCITENEKLYIPVEQFAAEVLGWCVKKDGQGLVITDDKPFDLYTEDTKPDVYIQGAHRFQYDYYKNMTPLRVLNHYMQFERPDKETLMEDFNKTTNNGELRPRVLASKKEFDTVRANKDNDAYLKDIVDEIIGTANTYLSNSEYDYAIPNGQDMLMIARGYKLEIEALSFAYQITKEAKYAEKVWNTLKTVFSYPDWNYSHMIDSGEMAAWTAIAYDWCYDYFNEEQRKYIEESMVKFIIDPYSEIIRDLRFTRETMGNAGDYATSKTNFNAVCNGGTIAACVALGNVYPEKCFDLLALAVRSIENVLLSYRPDGAWPESPSYWEYCTQYAGRGVSSLINAMGQHYGLLDAQGFTESAEWVMKNNSYGGSYAYHDADMGTTSSKMSTLISYYTGDEDLQNACYAQTASGIRTRWPEDALYYNPDCKGNADNLPLNDFYEGLDLAYSRSSFVDNNGFYFASHAGIVKPYHSQADVGNFVFDLNGERWAEDIGKEEYVIMRGGGKVAYRQCMQGHSVVVHDPPTNAWGMNYDGGEIPLNRYEEKPKGMIVSYNLNLAYQQFVSQHDRGFYVGDNKRSLTVQDRFTTLKAMNSYWFMQTPATTIEILDNQTALLHKNGKTLKLEVRCDVPGFELGYGPAQSIEGTAYKRVHIKMPVQAEKTYTITVKMYAYGESGISGIDEMTIPMEQWQIPDGEYVPTPVLNAKNIRVNGKKLNEVVIAGKIAVMEGQPLPVVTAEAENPENIVEIIEAEDGTYSTVRVWSPDKKYHSDTNIGYKITPSADLSAFNEIPISTFDVSSTLEEWNPKECMLDNNFLTRWTSAAQEGEYAWFDFGEAKQVDAVALAFWQGDTRNYKYKIEGSNDAENWTVLKEGQSAGKTEGFELMEFNGGSYRFIKVTGYGSMINRITNILEFRALTRK